jgi:hypothetical protein
VPRPSLSRIYQQLGVTGLVQTQEPKSRSIYGFANLCMSDHISPVLLRASTYRQQPVILQNNCLSISQVRGYSSALFAVQHDTSELRIDGVVFVKSQTVLRDHVKLTTENGERFAVYTMSMTGSVNIRPCFVDLAMDRERSGIDRLVSDDHLPFLVDED